jgi:predicted AlkP superfamily phosphohydrolase/phosphomutase
MAFHPKILFLAICAGERDLIVRWAQEGVLPTFKALLAKGLVGRTQSVPGLYVQCNWPAFYTGTGPAKQGIHSWQQLTPGTYDFYRAFTPDHVKSTPFWDHLSDAGRRVAILDIPHSGPSRKINGVQLVEWGAHDANHGFQSSPASLAAEIVERFGEHPQRGLCDADRTAEDMIEFRDGLLHGIDGKVAITKHFLAQEDWDFFAQVFTEAHCVGHQCWHLHDPAHPRHSRADVAIAGDPVKDVYVAIDRAIGEILAEVGEDTTVVVLASHGMQGKYPSQFMLGDILARLGVAANKAETDGAARWFGVKRALDPMLTWGWRHLPGFAKALLDPFRHRARDWVATPSRDLPLTLDPAASKCFIIPNNHTHGGIRVNLIGREPNGKVRPEEMDAFLDELGRDLMAIVNRDTGKRIVNRIMRTKDYFQGPLTEHFPDLLVEWTCADPVKSVESPKLGRLDKKYNYCRTGEHNPAGMFVAYGPGIAPGRLERLTSIMDFAPTFCKMLGVEVDEFDGRAIAEIVGPAKSHLAASPSWAQRPADAAFAGARAAAR